MIKIFLTVRNRLAITKKCIEAVVKHTRLKFQIHVYDNASNSRVKEHFEYFYNLYKFGIVSKIVFNTEQSTFNAFSKAVACNDFGHDHQMDPNKNKYDFLTILDNDVIVYPEWDMVVLEAWEYVKNKKMDNIKIVSQLPGGIKNCTLLTDTIRDKKIKIGKLGGSAFWNVRPNFFSDVGFLKIKNLINKHKNHDINYWNLLEKSSKGKPYILGISYTVSKHMGGIAGSICNTLSRFRNSKDRYEKIKFKDAESKIDCLSFSEFFKLVQESNFT